MQFFEVFAGVFLCRANTEATVDAGVTDIAANKFGAVPSTTWSRGGIYVDGWFGCSQLENDMENMEGSTIASPSANAYAVAFEIGSLPGLRGVKIGDDFGKIGELMGAGDLTLPCVRLLSSARFWWNDVDLNDYVSTEVFLFLLMMAMLFTSAWACLPRADGIASVFAHACNRASRWRGIHADCWRQGVLKA